MNTLNPQSFYLQNLRYQNVVDVGIRRQLRMTHQTILATSVKLIADLFECDSFLFLFIFPKYTACQIPPLKFLTNLKIGSVNISIEIY